MGFFSSLRSKQLAPTWTFVTSGVCWRLLPTSDGFFVGEDRDIVSKTVSFFCIDRRTGKEVWSKVRFETPWWIGLEAIQGNVVFLHEYAVPDMPDHKKIYALDILSGKLLWMDDELKFLFANGDRVYAALQQFEEPKFIELDLESGKRIGEVDADYLDGIRERVSPDLYHFINFPLPYMPDEQEVSLFYTGIQEILEKTRNAVQLEFLPVGQKLAFSYYDSVSSDPKKPGLQQHIAVLSQERNTVLYRDVVHAKATIPAPDTFFSIGDLVYYVREKSIIVAINLSDSTLSHDKN